MAFILNKECIEPVREEVDRYFISDGNTPVVVYKGRGCIECHNTGYQGRVAIQEVFVITESVRTLIARGASILDIEEAARSEGFRSMRYDGFKKILRGLTTLGEVERVTEAD